MTEQKPKRTPRTRTTTKATKETKPEIEIAEEAKVVTESKPKEEKVEPKKNVRKSIASIDLNDLIPVVAMVDSVIFVADNTKAEYEWDSKGDTQYITYSELVSMKGRQKRFFDEMWIYIDDKEVVEALNLTPIYEKYDEIKSVEDYLAKFKSNYDLKEALNHLPNGIKKSLGRQAAKLIQEDKLDSHNTIKALEDCLGVELVHLLK